MLEADFVWVGVSLAESKWWGVLGLEVLGDAISLLFGRCLIFGSGGVSFTDSVECSA